MTKEPLFDRFAFVDWSARTGRGPRRERKDSVWIGFSRPGRPPEAGYFRTRAEGTESVRTFLRDALGCGDRVLVGFDFPLGYPRGLAVAAGWGRPAWRATWDGIATRLRDGEDNRSNRFLVAESLNQLLGSGPGPFWGRPVPRSDPRNPVRDALLAPTSPGFPFTMRNGAKLEKLRACDVRLPGTQECWKLYGAGSVGSQALTGIPCVRSLRDDPDLASASAIWPFETGFTSRLEARIVHAEMWPGIVNDRVLLRREPIRDQAQVLVMCEWARDLDRRGRLGDLLDQPAGLSGADLRAVLDEEGWVLGCT